MARIKLTEEIKTTGVSTLRLVSKTADTLAEKAPEAISETLDLYTNTVKVANTLISKVPSMFEESELDKLEEQLEIEKLKKQLAKLKGES